MNAKEILERRSPAYYTIEELEFLVSDYIYRKKGIRVKVNVHKEMPEGQVYLNPFGKFKIENEYKNLFNALEIIQKDYFNNDIKN